MRTSVYTMTEHIKSWIHDSSAWRGCYSLDVLKPYCKKGLLLDAGCGNGRYALPLRMYGFDVVAVDVSLDALKTARERSISRRLDIDFLAANIYQMPFSDASFDVIWCYGVLQHLLLRERELAVIEYRRMLKKEGMLFIEVFGEDDMRYGGNEIEHNTFSRKNNIIYHYFNKNELDGLLKGFSCKIVESMKEKRFDGKHYMRHMISVFGKSL